MKSHTEKLIEATQSLLEFKFPKIKNIEILAHENMGMVISFDEGEYTQEEVERFLDTDIREEIKKTIIPTNFDKTNFGYNPIFNKKKQI